LLLLEYWIVALALALALLAIAADGVLFVALRSRVSSAMVQKYILRRLWVLSCAVDGVAKVEVQDSRFACLFEAVSSLFSPPTETRASLPRDDLCYAIEE
jgi:hypothetical protein